MSTVQTWRLVDVSVLFVKWKWNHKYVCCRFTCGWLAWALGCMRVVPQLWELFAPEPLDTTAPCLIGVAAISPRLCDVSGSSQPTTALGLSVRRGTRPCRVVSMSSVAAFVPQQQTRVRVTQTVKPRKPNVLTTLPLTGKVYRRWSGHPALTCTVCWLPRCKYVHQDRHQVTNASSLNAELWRDAKSTPSCDT